MNIIKPNDLEDPFRIAIVASRYNEHVTQRLYEGAVGRLNELKITTDLIHVAWVPGVVEIPIATQRFIDTDEIHVVLALGCVIKGGTRHDEVVTSMVSRGCMHIALESGVPVIFGVLTAPDETTAFDRAGGSEGNVGRDCVDTAFDTLSVIRQIDALEFE